MDPEKLLSFSLHKRPSLRLSAAFRAVQLFLSKIDPLFLTIRLRVGCQEISSFRHAVRGLVGTRSFMHVGHIPRVVCAFQGADRLPEGHLFGVMLHEFGHIGAGLERGERAADRWVLDVTGIRIRYVGRLDLEWINEFSIRMIMSGAR